MLNLISGGNLFAQTAPGKYWIQFTDKNNSGFSISQPSDFLSQRSLQRRIMQNIPIDNKDLPVTQAYIDSLESMGFTVLNPSKWLNSVTVQVDSAAQLASILSLGFVNGYQKVHRLECREREEASLTAQKPVSFLKYSSYNYGQAATQIEMMNGNMLHNQGFRGQGMQIAVIDAGFFQVDSIALFDSLWANNQILGVRDFVDHDHSVFEDYHHGMKVLSILAANVPGSFIGVAPKASYWLLRSENVQSEYVVEEDNWVAAAEFADSVGADILTTSLGYTTFNDPAQNHDYSDMDGNTTRISIASDIAASRGMLVVNSAGNEGNDPWHYISAPADGDSVLAVGAVDDMGAYAPFSSTGPSADGQVKPNVAAMGMGTTVSSTSGSVSSGSGTSFSAPLVAGLAACLWQANPGMTNMELFQAIEQSGSQYQNPDSLLGYGIPDFAAANLLLHNVIYDQFDKEAIFKVFPNPFSSQFSIQLYSPDSQLVRYSMYDMKGSLILSSEKNMDYTSFRSIDVKVPQTLENGIYFLRLVTQNAVYSIKVIKGKN